MSAHTKVFGLATLVVAVIACTVVSLDLPTMLDFTGAQVEALRTAILIVPILAIVTVLCLATDLLTE